MVHFRESDKMIKISRKVDRSNTYNGFSSNNRYSQKLLKLNIFLVL